MSVDSTLKSGILLEELDASIRPQDDLFRHVNGKWIARTEIPADKARYGSFYVLAEEAEKAVRDIIVEAQAAESGTEARKLGDLYASFMDEARAEELGATPLAPLLSAVAAVESIDTLLTTLGRLERKGVNGFFQLFVDNDPGDPERYLVFLEQGGLGLPDESYYRQDTFAEIRDKYVDFLERMFGLAKVDDAAARSRPNSPATTGTTSPPATARPPTTCAAGTRSTRASASGAPRSTCRPDRSTNSSCASPASSRVWRPC
jgi:putative endopeptidase